MSFIRLPLRAALHSRPLVVVAPRAPLSTSGLRFAQQDYGSGEGDPRGEQPQKQGRNPSVDKEHPGPPPPAEGRGTGGVDAKSKSSGSTQSSGGSGSSSKSKHDAQPKILKHEEPEEVMSNPDESVQKHNREFENRYDRPAEHAKGSNQQVSKKFWSGHGGAHGASS